MDIWITRHQLRTVLNVFEPNTENEWKVYNDLWAKLNGNGEILCQDVSDVLGKVLGS